MSSGKPSAGNETERESEPAASSRREKASGVETKVLTRYFNLDANKFSYDLFCNQTRRI